MQIFIKSRAPLRISFVGGGTDVSPFPEKYGGLVINATINKYINSTLRFRRDRKLTIEIIPEGRIVYPDIGKITYDGRFDVVKAVIKHLYKGTKGLDIFIYKDIGSRSGLGGSAALFVSIIGLFNELLTRKLNKYEIAELAFKLERDELKNLGGRQDQYASVFGGINFIEFKGKDFVRLSPLNIPLETIYALEENLILLNLGDRGVSGVVIEDQIKNIKTDKSTVEAMKKTKEMTYLLKESLLSGDINKFGKILNYCWKLKKKFSSKISNTNIDLIYNSLKKEGAVGGKISGAGGGGHMFVLAKLFNRYKVEQRALRLNVKLVSFKFENNGLVTWKSNF